MHVTTDSSCCSGGAPILVGQLGSGVGSRSWGAPVLVGQLGNGVEAVLTTV